MDQLLLTDDLLTGVDDIDAQHRKLFRYANLIVDPTTRQGQDDSLVRSLAFLVEYVHFHFAAEELAMKQSAYPETDGHARSHVRFRNKVAKFLEASRDEPSPSELRDFLKAAIVGWLTEHIRVNDKAFAVHLMGHAGGRAATLPNAEALVAAGLSNRPINLAQLEAAIGEQHPRTTHQG